MEESPLILPESKPPKEYPSIIKAFIILIKLVSYALAWVITTALLAWLMTYFVPDLNPEDLQEGDLRDWKSNSIIFIGVLAGTFLITWLFRVGVDRQSFESVGLKFDKVGVKLLKGAFYSLILLSSSFLILFLLGAVSIVDLQFEFIDLLGFLFLFLLAALVEELTFRGYMIPLIAKDFHFMFAIIGSSLIFAVLHMANAHFTWISFWNIFLGGYLMGLVFYKNQDLYMPLGLHWMWNYYQGNVLGFGVSGFKVESILSIEMNKSEWLTGGEFGLEGSIVTTTLLLIVGVWLTYKWYDDLQNVTII